MERFIKIHELQVSNGERHTVKDEESEVIGPALFKPLSKLGKGSFGEVYCVMKLPEKHLYAMKILHK
jgi:serine/threonine protein kinase